MRYLLNFSGGLDSTHVLYHHLKNKPREKLLVHFCHIKNYEGRGKYEKKSVANIVKWLQDNGLNNFKLIKTSFDIEELSVKPLDSQIVAFMNGIMFINKNYRTVKYFYTCTPHDEFMRLGRSALITQRELFARTRNLPQFSGKDNYDHDMLNIMPLKNKTKCEIWNELPEDLRVLTWSCRQPNKGKRCGKCHTCKQLEGCL